MSDLSNEISVNPLARAAYSGTDKEVADDMNTLYRPAPGTGDQIREYFQLEQKAQMHLYGRLKTVAKAAVGDNPLGDLSTPFLTRKHITSAQTMLSILEPPGDFSLDFSDSRFDSLLGDIAGGAANAQVITPDDKDAIQAFSLNQITRAQDLRNQGQDIPVPVWPANVGQARQ